MFGGMPNSVHAAKASGVSEIVVRASGFVRLAVPRSALHTWAAIGVLTKALVMVAFLPLDGAL